MTNYERIKVMSVDELADLIAKLTDSRREKILRNKGMLEWLQMEVDNNDKS